eukprot:1154868-Pelagomonas_calceolata.AAC.9
MLHACNDLCACRGCGRPITPLICIRAPAFVRAHAHCAHGAVYNDTTVSKGCTCPQWNLDAIQVYNDPEAAGAAPIRIQELVFLSAGFERTDANWISSLYKPEAATEHTDARVGSASCTSPKRQQAHGCVSEWTEQGMVSLCHVRTHVTHSIAFMPQQAFHPSYLLHCTLITHSTALLPPIPLRSCHSYPCTHVTHCIALSPLIVWFMSLIPLHSCHSFHFTHVTRCLTLVSLIPRSRVAHYMSAIQSRHVPLTQGSQTGNQEEPA